MLEWIVKNHEIFRDVATPVVTIAVGLVAVFVQIHFNRRQAVVSEDKLKFDLFEKRYGIYSAASELVQFVNSSKEEPGERNKFFELFTQLEQAQFFFDDEVCDFIAEVLTTSRKFVDLLNEADSVEVRTRIKETRVKLHRLYSELPLRIGPALRYSQMTRPR